MPDPPPEIPSAEPSQLQSVARGVIAETEQRIVQLKEMNRRSLEVHRTIFRRLEEYRRFVFYQKYLVAPIRRLPSELLSEIFVICVVDNIETNSGVLYRQWILAQVCRRWRHVVLNTPRIWNRPPRIVARPAYEANPSSVKTHFERAGGVPLSIDIYIAAGTCAKSSPLLATLIKHSHQIGELKINCQWEAFRAISKIRSELNNLRTLTLTTTIQQTNSTSVFSLAPQLRDVSFMSKRILHGDQFSKLVLPWGQLKTITINRPDLDYAWKVFSNAPHMETCTLIETVNSGKPQGIVRHVELQQLHLKWCLNCPAVPTPLFDALVLPNLINLLIKVGDLTIDPVASLITRSGCSLSKLVLNVRVVRGSLLKLLEETDSLIHLEVHALSLADIKGLTVDKKDGNRAITPSLREIHIANVDRITDPSTINALIRSRDDPEVSHVKPIQSIHLHCNISHLSKKMHGRLTGLPWMPSGLEFRTVKWADSLRKIIDRLGPPPPHQVSLFFISTFSDLKHLVGLVFLMGHPYQNGALGSD